jgi:DNA-binding CsgD family transcriptional regulator
LTQHEVRSLLDFLGGVYALRDRSAFVARAGAALRRLVPSDLATFNQFDAQAGTVAWLTDPPGAAFPGSERIFAAHLSEHPIVVHRRRTADSRVLAISDFLTRRQLRGLGLYQELFGPMGIEFAVSVPLRVGPVKTLTVGLTREHSDFSGPERRLLEWLRPHLAQAYRNAETISRFHRDRARGRRASEGLPMGPTDGGPTGFGGLGLTPRERDVVTWLVQGKSNEEIATILSARPRTVAKHLERMYQKLGVESRTAAVSRLLGGLAGPPASRRRSSGTS